MRETLLMIQTEMIYMAMTGTMRLPDPVLAVIIGRFRKIAALLADREDESVTKTLEELEGFFRDESPHAAALKKMMLEARPSQMKSVIRGYLVNYVYDW